MHPIMPEWSRTWASEFEEFAEVLNGALARVRMARYAESYWFIRNAARLAVIAVEACPYLLLALALWNLAATKWEHTRNPVPGVLFGWRAANALVLWGAGSPTAVIEAG